MSFPHRIRTVYYKELIDILRDHRTLIAMIVVPIVLYPLLLLGSVQAVSYQSEKFSDQELVIGVIDEAQGQALDRLIRADAQAIREEKAQADPPLGEQDPPVPIEQYRITALGSVEAIKEHIARRAIHVGVTFDSGALVDAPTVTNDVRFFVDQEDPRGFHAVARLRDAFERTAERTRARRIAEARLPAEFAHPFRLETTNLSAPQSILGQVLPLILVLMTITGAIYPAIDLTAGERERGTLESLMVCPMPVFELIVGKFLVVTTVAIMGAALNLASVSATVYFGGFRQIIAQEGGSVPLGSMIFILLCLIPFAVFMSAIMLAVCSCARTFKEAQNYVTPVILAVLIPGGIAALPTTQLGGVMLVMPVGNMVLLAREVLMGATVPVLYVLMIVLSTTLYAAAAVAVAATVFGKESVVFADSGSLRSVLNRRFVKPSLRPGITMSLFTVAVLFPVWFFVQGTLQPGPDGEASRVLIHTGWLMPVLFVAVPLVIAVYWRVDVRGAFALRRPAARFVVAAVLIGLSAWVVAHELNVVQARMLGVPDAVVQSAKLMQQALESLNPVVVILLIAVIPALCEEALFRGFLLSGLRDRVRSWTAVLVSAVIFGAYHFLLFRIPVTVVLGCLLGFLCWQAHSIWPAVIAHAMHNGVGVLTVFYPGWQLILGIESAGEPSGADGVGALEADYVHLPPHILIVGGLVLAVGIVLALRGSMNHVERPTMEAAPEAAAV